ncbi:hypothetical protein Scep_013809 [Stephania cephalantha]|uniref:Uncharacterized protein n=1 Tax=Stephania cephalantha TaxID=152367 RepID=A0AAP0J051_9MAGN
MATSSGNPRDEDESMDAKTLISFYSIQIWRRIIGSLPFRDSNLYSRISSLHLRSLAKRRSGLPLPLPRQSLNPTHVSSEVCRVFDVLEGLTGRILSSLHDIQKNLQFWQHRAEGTDFHKIYFMVCERGPRAFFDGTAQLLRGCLVESAPWKHICYLATSQISEKIAILTHLQHCLSTFLSQVYVEVDKLGQDLITESEKSLPSLVVAIDNLFSELEASMVHLNQSDSCVSLENSLSPMFDKLPEINEDSRWTDCELRDAISLIYHNLDKLDGCLSPVIAKVRKPRRTSLYWFRYTCGAVGLSVCSIWLLRHSRLMGSSDIDNWIREARESTVGFWNEHVEQPLLSIRDDLFETFQRRHKGVKEMEEVQLSTNTLRRMLLAFVEQQRDQKLPEDASDREMLEIVMARYEKDVMRPIQNLLGGEMASALLIQIQKLKLDIETAMLELDQILKANQINFAILAALPAFFLSIVLLMLVRASFKQGKGAKGRGRIARRQRRLLIVEVEETIAKFQNFIDHGREEAAIHMFGLTLYNLDRLYRSVEGHAKATGEWQRIKQDIITLAKPGLPTAYKLIITSRMERVYDCLVSSPSK